MPGHRIGMPPPLSDGAVTYDDGAPQTVDQYSKDVSAFLMWAAEPHLEERKQIGLRVVLLPDRAVGPGLFHQAEDLGERPALTRQGDAILSRSRRRSPLQKRPHAVGDELHRERGEQHAEQARQHEIGRRAEELRHPAGDQAENESRSP